MSKMYDVVIIGCGAIAGGYDQASPLSDDVLTHAKAYALHPGFRMVGCVDPDQQRREAFQKFWGIPYGFGSLNTVNVHFDVASVCVPTDFHADILRQLLARKPRLVFAEKPITDHLGTSQEIVQAYARAGVGLCVNHLRRFASGIGAIRQEIISGQWGTFKNGTALYTKGLLNNGSHMLDIIKFLLGPLKPLGRLCDVVDGRVGDPTSDVVVATTEDKIVCVKGSDGNDFTVFEIDLLFERGRIRLVDSSFTVIRHTVEASSKFPGYFMLNQGVSEPTHLGQALLGAVDNIYRSLEHGDPLVSDGESALAAHLLCAKLAAMPSQFIKEGA